MEKLRESPIQAAIYNCHSAELLSKESVADAVGKIEALVEKGQFQASHLRTLRNWPEHQYATVFWEEKLSEPSNEDPIRSANAVVLAQLVVNLWKKNHILEPSVANLLWPLRGALAEQFYLASWQPQSALNECLKLLDAMGLMLARWYPELGERARKEVTKVEIVMQEALQSEDDPEAAVKALKSAWYAFQEREQSRLDKAHDRLRTMMEGALNARESQQRCCQIISEVVAGRKLPKVTAELLQGPWLESMQYLLINEGEKSSLWRNTIELTEALVNAVAPEEGISSNDAIAKVTTGLPRMLVSLKHNPAAQVQWLDKIDALHTARIKDGNCALDTSVNLPIPGINQDSHVEVSEHLLRRTRGIMPGDWFLYSGQYTGRAQMLMASQGGQRYIFSNANGQKAFEFGLEELAFLMAKGEAKEFPSGPLAKRVCESFIGQAEARLKDLEAQKATEERVMVEAEARAVAKRKAAEEAARVRERQRAAEMEALRKEKEKIQAEKFRLEVERTVDRMDFGYSIYLPVDGKVKRMKFAVRLASSGKLLFTNEKGETRLDFKPEELVKRILAGEISLHPLDYHPQEKAEEGRAT